MPSSTLCPHCFLPNTSSLIADWTFNGTTEDVSPLQFGRATIVNPNVNTALTFENPTSFTNHIKQGFMQVRTPGYLNVPAATFLQNSSFTMSWDIRIPAVSTTRMVLLSNWKQYMWQFMTFLDPDLRVGCVLRRDMATGGTDPEQGLVDVITANPIPIGEWVNIAFSFNRTNRTFYVYVNGTKSNESVVRSSVTDMNLHTSDATQFQFGFQADASSSNGTMNADIRNLRFTRLQTSSV